MDKDIYTIVPSKNFYDFTRWIVKVKKESLLQIGFFLLFSQLILFRQYFFLHSGMLNASYNSSKCSRWNDCNTA